MKVEGNRLNAPFDCILAQREVARNGLSGLRSLFAFLNIVQLENLFRFTKPPLTSYHVWGKTENSEK